MGQQLLTSSCAPLPWAVCQRGEFYHNPSVLRLFERHGYVVRPTSADVSYQNVPVEQSHQTIGNALHSMLSGAGLEAKLWPYVFKVVG